MTTTSRHPSAALTITAATVVAWLSIIAVALAFDDGRSAGDRSATAADGADRAPVARPGRAGPGYAHE